jgi:hypothetical protein
MTDVYSTTMGGILSTIVRRRTDMIRMGAGGIDFELVLQPFLLDQMGKYTFCGW